VLVEGLTSNIKVTRPEDLDLAGFYLQQSAAQPLSGSNPHQQGE
jgi:2-C-methyl-D-erythritol 4-phosphate cytidylyltransferase